MVKIHDHWYQTHCNPGRTSFYDAHGAKPATLLRRVQLVSTLRLVFQQLLSLSAVSCAWAASGTVVSTDVSGAPLGLTVASSLPSTTSSWYGLFFLVPFTAWWFFVMFIIDRLSPLPALRARYPLLPVMVPELRRGSARVGMISLKNCVRLALSPDGLFIKMVFPFSCHTTPICIPLSDLHTVTEKRFLFRTRILVTVAIPAMTTLELPEWLFESCEAGRQLRQAAKPPHVSG